ncbi:hypothetical protein [Accumulibacter sp.]|uniref:hypothetical protein n=1 Tax=Accumulibacter sp. TaxID=2053492 RepID=UPI002D1FAE70|nr:hypothetical protein [Accumulibacter sp.]
MTSRLPPELIASVDAWAARNECSRAEAIRTLMLKRGVPPERIVVTWSAGGRDIADNTTETGRAMNRRVEVLFVKAAKTAASTQ